MSLLKVIGELASETSFSFVSDKVKLMKMIDLDVSKEL